MRLKNVLRSKCHCQPPPHQEADHHEVELHAFMEMDPSLRSGSQAAINMVSATPPQPLMATASTSQDDMMGTLIKESDKKFKKRYHKQIKTLRIQVQVVPTVVPFVLMVPDQIDKLQAQIKIKNIEIRTTTIDKITIRTTVTITVAISKITDTTIIAIHQISNETEITQINNLVNFATEQITNPETVKLVLIAKHWDICLANVEHHDKIKIKGNKIRILIKTRKISIKTATQNPHSNKKL